MNKILFASRHILLYVMISAMVAVNTGCSKKTHKTESESELLSVQVALPIVKDVVLSDEYPGYLSALTTVNLVARVSGSLEQINYKAGSRVKKGDLLFVIEPTTYRDEVNQAQAMLSESNANLAYTQATYERTKEAAKANAVSEIQVIQTLAEYEQSVAAVKNYQAQLQTANTNLGYCYVRAPFTGRVTKNVYDVGNYLNGGSAPTLATIYQDDKLYVYFSVSDNKYINQLVMRNKPRAEGGLSELDIVVSSVDSLPVFKAELEYFAPSIDVSTGTITVRGLINNEKGLLRDGMYVKVMMPYEKRKGAILIPDESIGTNQLGHYVYIVNDSSVVEQRNVGIGQLLENNMRVIDSGVKAGERYVTTALVKVRNGMKVKPISQK